MLWPCANTVILFAKAQPLSARGASESCVTEKPSLNVTYTSQRLIVISFKPTVYRSPIRKRETVHRANDSDRLEIQLQGMPLIFRNRVHSGTAGRGGTSGPQVQLSDATTSTSTDGKDSEWMRALQQMRAMEDCWSSWPQLYSVRSATVLDTKARARPEAKIGKGPLLLGQVAPVC